MSPRYEDTILPSRAIYANQSKNTKYSLILFVVKILKAFGLFLVYDLLKLVHLVPFLFIVTAGSALTFLVLQRPRCRGLTRHQLFRIVRHSLASCLIQLLWLFGLSLCGPLRTTLIFEHSPLVIAAAGSALFRNVGGPSKFRGAVFLLIAILGIIFFDHDDYDADGMETFHPEGQHNGIIRHTFYHFLSWSGLSDHKGGVCLLVVTLLANVVFANQSKKLSVELGGAKRLHTLSTMTSSLLLLPWAAFVQWNTEEVVLSLWNGLLPFGMVILTVFVMDYYAEAVTSAKIEPLSVARQGSVTIFTAALLFSFVWSHPFIETLTGSLNAYKELMTEDHLLSGGVVFSLVLFYFATGILTSRTKDTVGRGSFVGYSSAGLPLYSFAEEQAQRTHSAVMLVKGLLSHILENGDSRNIFYFLLLNLSFTFVELLYGAWTNSLGLISDGFHMLFDCSALVVGLYAAVMSKWKATRIFSYGYDRVEVLSGFANGLFLVVVSFFIILAAVSRLIHPPHVDTDKLLTVSVLGLLVNLFGIMAFSHAHTHGGGSHGHGSGSHSHGGGSHSHGSHSHGDEVKNSNMRGVFLHVLADTLGSVGVIISTLLIEYFDWNIADPICSLFIGVMIFLSVIPLLTDTANVLLLKLPDELKGEASHALEKILAIEGVLSYREHHIWRHSGSTLCATIHIQISPNTSEQLVTTQATTILKAIGVKNISIQVEKEAYFTHLNGLNSVPSSNQIAFNMVSIRAV